MISDVEIQARLDADSGLIREKIKAVGTAALWSLITAKEPIPANEMADHVRFMALSMLDRDGDVLDPEAKKSYLRRHASLIL